MLGLNHMQRINQKASRADESIKKPAGDTREKGEEISPEVKARNELAAVMNNNIFTYMKKIYTAPINANPNRTMQLDVISPFVGDEHHHHNRFKVQVLMKEPQYDTHCIP